MKLANDGEIQIEMPLLREVLYENMFAEANFFIYNRLVLFFKYKYYLLI